MSIQELKAQITQLPPEQITSLSQWLAELDEHIALIHASALRPKVGETLGEPFEVPADAFSRQTDEQVWRESGL